MPIADSRDHRVDENGVVPSARKPVLILVCGLPGAGKTTLARQLERDMSAIRLCPDDWIADLGLDFFDDALRERLEQRFRRLSWDLLRHGQDVILEFGSWIRPHRDELREAARALGAGVQLYFLDTPVDEIWERLQRRNSTAEHGSVPVTRAQLEASARIFQAPTPAEQALFDPRLTIPLAEATAAIHRSLTGPRHA